jgi:superfamily II DNA or RNA helicase
VVNNSSKIIVEKVNEVYIRIHTELSIAQEISEFFTFMAPNYQFNPLYKERKWDGKIKLYNKKTKQLFLGLYKHLEQFCKERNYTLEGLEYKSESWSLKESIDFIADLKLQAHGKSIEPHEHQIMAITKALRYLRRVILSPTNSGKSLIAYVIVRHLLQKGYKGLIVVPTTSLVEQLYKDFHDYSSVNGWNAESNVHKIYQGQDKFINKNVTISTWQSIYDITDKDFFKKFDFVIGDEAHHFQAKCLGKIMTNLTNARYRIGMSGTIQDTEVHRLALEGHFGPVTRVATNRELMDKKISADLNIKCLVLKYPSSVCSATQKFDYHEEMDFLVTNKSRNSFITNLTLSLKNNSLVLFQYVDKHGKQLHALIKAKNKDPDRKIFFVSGGTHVDDREEIRKIIETENDAIIIASYGVFSTGINIRNIHHIVFASPSKSKIRVLQSIGRGLRVSDTKSSVALYDISDDLRIGKHTNYTLTHYSERVKIYHEEKFMIKVYNITLGNNHE